MGDEEQAEGGFRVVDRRASAAAPGSAPSEEVPGVDFASFCLSLATSALYHLGAVAHPESQDSIPEPNLPLARQTIDSLEMLEAKTRGNLDDEEARLLEGLLYELRMRFVEAGHSGGSAGGTGE